MFVSPYVIGNQITDFGNLILFYQVLIVSGSESTNASRMDLCQPVSPFRQEEKEKQIKSNGNTHLTK